jgi:hypothetical protein
MLAQSRTSQGQKQVEIANSLLGRGGLLMCDDAQCGSAYKHLRVSYKSDVNDFCCRKSLPAVRIST